MITALSSVFNIDERFPAMAAVDGADSANRVAEQRPLEVNSGSGSKVVLNSLLCFINNKKDELPSDTIVNLCLKVFNTSDIEIAKEELAALTPNGARIKKRVGPKKDTTNLEDIVKKMHELDSLDNEFIFATADLKKLPPITFNSIDVTVLLSRVQSLNDEVTMLKTGIASQHQTNSALQSVCSDMQKVIQQNSTRLDRVEQKDIEMNVAATHNLPSPPKADSIENPAGCPNMNTAKKPTESESDCVTEEQLQLAVGHHPGFLPNHCEPVSKKDKSEERNNTWSTVVRNSKGKLTAVPEETKKPARPVTQKNPSHRKRTIGTAKTDQIKAVIKQKWASVFASRFSPSQDIATLKQYLEEKTDLDVSVQKLDSRHPEKYSSFHIHAECINPSIFMSDDLWPAGIYVRWFKPDHKRNGPSQDIGGN